MWIIYLCVCVCEVYGVLCVDTQMKYFFVHVRNKQ